MPPLVQQRIDFLNAPRVDPVFFPEIVTDSKGKECKKYHYKNMMTPYEKLKSLHDSEKYLKQGVKFETLEKFAME